MKVAVLATGGKDSALALNRILKQGYKVKCLVSMVPLREDSWMFHYPNIRLVKLFAEAAEIPLASAETSGVKELEVEDLKRLIAELDVEILVSGAIASNYQKSRIERICEELGIKCLTPLWGEDPVNILNELVTSGFETIITGVYAYGFSQEWLGRKIDEKAIRALVELNKRYGISVVGEGGEYETFVLDAPYFKKRIKIVSAEKFWKHHSGYLLIKEAVLESK
ncbi:MAG: TIGR00289 family protein [Candidatus Bathyarchaeia archaeon]